MRHPERVEDYLGHIAQAIERASSYLQPLPDFEAFRNNQQVQDAAVRNLEIIGRGIAHHMWYTFDRKSKDSHALRMRSFLNAIKALSSS
jgi:uncharacterized protein with HEPN domain